MRNARRNRKTWSAAFDPDDMKDPGSVSLEAQGRHGP
jgi:hypothetical protein